MTLQVFAHIHLPGVVPDHDIVFANGVVQALPFDHWRDLDRSLGFSASKYEKTRPHFWISKLTIAEEREGAVADAVLQRASLLHQSLLLDPRAPPLASPGISTVYASLDAARSATLRIIGQAEREWIVFGGIPEFSFDDAAFAHADKAFAMLEALPAEYRETPLGSCLDVLERTARPEYWYDDEESGASLSSFVQCIAACEGLVTVDKERDVEVGLTDRFGHRLGTLLAPTFDEQDVYAREFADYYRIRSRLMHGRIASANLDARAKVFIERGRNLLRAAAAVALILVGRDVRPETLPSVLADARGSAEAFASLRAKLKSSADV